MRAALRILRSRVLAVALIGGIVAYAVVTTLPAVALARPFANPAFLAASALLAVSTAVCAWDRTRRALRMWRMSRSAVDSSAGGRGLALFSVTVSEDAAGIEAASLALRGLGLRVREVDGALVGRRNGWAVAGSPLMHWALVGLFVTAALGQAARSEGPLAVVVGSTLTDERDAYDRGVRVGPLFRERFSGLTLEVDRIVFDHEAGGAERGDSPYVRVRDGERVVAEGVVYPNHPLVHGGVWVHRDEIGPAIELTIEFPNGEVAERHPVALTGTGAYGAPMAELAATNRATGEVARLGFEAVTGQRIVVLAPEEEFRSGPISVGETAMLPDGTRVTLENATLFAALTVVNDPTVPLVYLFSALICVGAVIALLVPVRSVAVRRGDEPGEIVVSVRHGRADAAFPDRVREELTAGG